MSSGESLFRTVKELLGQEDIEGLLEIGSPSDEYDGEASLIEDAICKATDFGKIPMDVAEVENVVARIWNQKFGPFDETAEAERRPAYHRVARLIVESE
jgi:hypothetical protein